MLGTVQVGKNAVPVVSEGVRILVATKEALEDLVHSDVFRARDLKVLDQSTSFGTTDDLSSTVYNRVVSPNFRFKAHHLVSVEVRVLRVSVVEVVKVQERSPVTELVYTTQTYRDVTSQSSQDIVQGSKGSELRAPVLVEHLLESVFEERSVH